MSSYSSFSNSNTMSNGKSVDEDNGKKSTSNIKSAADLLLKGGTLLSDSCVKCKGVQVRYKDETICVSCGRKLKDTANNDVTEQQQQQQQQQIENEQQQQHSIPDSNLSKKEFKIPTVFDSSITNTMNTKIITDKINFLITTLENENDILIQNTKLDLISKYLEVLDKLKIISNSQNSNKKS
ncbi:MAG TPA: autoantigen p27 domain-containing protein [Nitrososphaeraceae archaeon]|nr:autoantigen p27 domain-containing protein [Nitrososphaeraceae archaeon]